MVSRGVTIVELIVSIALMALIAGAVFVNWQPADETFALVRSAHQLAGDLRRAQQLSISTRVFSCSEVHADYSGYGLYLTDNQPTQYLIFENCGSNNRLYDQLIDQAFEFHQFENDVRIKSIDVGGPAVSASVLFVPPDPIVYINDQKIGVEAIIILELVNSPSETKEIKINTGGRIEIN